MSAVHRLLSLRRAGHVCAHAAQTLTVSCSVASSPMPRLAAALSTSARLLAEPARAADGSKRRHAASGKPPKTPVGIIPVSPLFARVKSVPDFVRVHERLRAGVFRDDLSEPLRVFCNIVRAKGGRVSLDAPELHALLSDLLQVIDASQWLSKRAAAAADGAQPAPNATNAGAEAGAEPVQMTDSASEAEVETGEQAWVPRKPHFRKGIRAREVADLLETWQLERLPEAPHVMRCCVQLLVAGDQFKHLGCFDLLKVLSAFPMLRAAGALTPQFTAAVASHVASQIPYMNANT
ncbi:hypothetical protein EON67_05725, partial [archaeon]